MGAGAYPSYLQFLYPPNTCLWTVGGSQLVQPEDHADTGRMHNPQGKGPDLLGNYSVNKWSYRVFSLG